MAREPVGIQGFEKGEKTTNHFSTQKTGRLLGIKEASKFLGLPVWTIRTLIWNRELPIVRIGERRQYLDIEDLNAYVERRKEFF